MISPDTVASAADATPRANPLVRPGGLVAAAAVLALLCLLSLAVGARTIPLGDAWRALFVDDGSQAAYVIRDLRVPRTALALLVGAALGLAGALMQALTRNPLADPGLFGVEAGAAAAVVAAIAFLGVQAPIGYVWFAVAGAGVTSVLVYALGSTGRAVTPERMVLAGAAVSASLGALISTALILDARTFDEFRFWAIGSFAGRGLDVLVQVGPLILVGAVVALALAPALNALALGEAVGSALGVRVARTRLAGAVAVALLCGGATAAAGPIAFVGLLVPHAARMIVGPDQRWLMPYSLVLAPALVVGADLLGRVLVAPGELEVGIVLAFVGAPVFIALCRRRRLAHL